MEAAALAAASAGSDVPTLYQFATDGLSVQDKKVVQCRLKEAILKTSSLYGVPRSLQALLPLFATLEDNEIENYGPRYVNPRVLYLFTISNEILLTEGRYESLGSQEAASRREKKGREYFDTIWTPAAAQANRDKNFKYQKDLCKSSSATY